MVEKHKSPSPDDDSDAWEDLAKDLFGVEFDETAQTDDLDDDLLDDDFLADTSDNPVVVSETVEAVEPVVSDDDGTEFDFEADEDEDDDLDEEDDDFDDDEDDFAAEILEPTEEVVPTAAKPVDDFWDALEKFAPEELGSPHLDQGQQSGRPKRDPKIGVVENSPRASVESDVPTASRDLYSNDDPDFGLGVLNDIETDEDDDADEGESNESSNETQAAETEEKKPRRRRSRRRGRRRKKRDPESAGDEESKETEKPLAESAPAAKAAVEQDPSNSDDSDDEDDDQDFENESDSDRVARHANVPSWEQAIDLIVKRTGPKSTSSRSSSSSSSTESTDEKGTRKRRSRGGRRRRGRGSKKTTE